MKTGLYYTITQPITRCSLVSYCEDVSFQPGKEKKMCWVIYYHLVFFLRWHILKSDLHVDFIDLIIAVVKRYVCKKKKKSKAWDLIDVSVCTEEILMNCLSFPLYNSVNMPDTRSCFFTCIRLNLIGPSFSSDSCKWRGCLCTSQVNRSRKKAPPGICLTVWALGPFNLAFLGLLPATLYVCNLNGAQLLLKSPEESSLQRRKKKPPFWWYSWGTSHLFRSSLLLHVEVICTAAPATIPTAPSALLPEMEQREQIQAKSKLFYSCCTTNKQTSGSIQSGPLEGLWALPKRGKWWGMGCREAGGDRGEARWQSCGC